MCNPDQLGRPPPTREREEHTAYWRAVAAFGSLRFAAYARQIVYGLQRTPPTSIFDMDCANSIWDEFCYEVQNGPHEALRHSWDSLLRPHLNHIAASIPKDEALLLSLAANEIFNDHQHRIEDWNAISDDNIRNAIEHELRMVALDRDLDRIVRRKRKHGAGRRRSNL